MTESSVRVGVRVRPLVAREKGQGVIIDSYDNDSLVFKNQTFTFDQVFGMELSQSQLYQNTAAPMLKSFLEGYNCTIMAYGQTGSGKTHTMGTSDMSNQDIESQGLIPRFVNDLFENLNNNQVKDLQSYKIKTSFLEIYGEDVFDLLTVSSGNNSNNRTSLLVREDENGKVFVQGQSECEVKDAISALEVLNMGSHNRVTASTAMNSGSSRSHAVFTLTLEQKLLPEGASEEEINLMTSKLTFVDLAGSERIKRTGAEGQRLKEGIQINSGLFNLGQVINSLADEQKLKTGNKNNFVPYRNSKLTHLLKDALGGNSQTLFLACVSPADSNEAETHSTLNYARQARNIRNKPVRNMDKAQLELSKLRYATKVWMLKAVSLMFKENANPNSEAINAFSSPAKRKPAILSPSAATFEACQINNSGQPIDDEALLNRPDVKEFIESVNASIFQKIEGIAPSPRKVRLSNGFNHVLPSKFMSPKFGVSPTKTKKPAFPGNNDYPIVDEFEISRPGRESILMSSDLTGALEAASQLDETEQLVERMIAMVHEEKKLLGVENPATISQSEEQSGELSPVESAANTAANEQEIIAVDRLIQEKEEILTKLMDNIKGYSVLKMEFEKLLDAINSLEEEKKDLENELEKAKKTNQSSSQMDKIKERFQTVKDELRKMKEDRKMKEQAYQVMQRETKQCDIMQREISKLKEAKVQMQKQQKSQMILFQKTKKENQQKITMLKKNEVKKQQMVNNLKTELTKKDRLLNLKDNQMKTLSMKLKASEEHVMQLLKLQNRIRNGNNSTASSASGVSRSSSTNSSKDNKDTANNLIGCKLFNKNNLEKIKNILDTNDYEYLISSRAIVELSINSQVERKMVAKLYERKSKQLKQLNGELMMETEELETLFTLRNNMLTENKIELPKNDEEEAGKESDPVILSFSDIQNLTMLSDENKYILENIQSKILSIENNIDRISREIDLCNADLDDLSLKQEEFTREKPESPSPASPEEYYWDVLGKEIIFGLNLTQSQALLMEFVTEKATLLETVRTSDEELTIYKASNDSLQERIQDLTQQLGSIREDFATRIGKVEKQRIMDVWAILKAHQQVNTPSNEENEIDKEVKYDETTQETVRNVLLQRTKDLEKELDQLLQNEEESKQQKQSSQEQMQELQKQVEEFNHRIQLQEMLLSQQNQTSQVNSDSSSSTTLVSSDYFNQLQSYWVKIGTLSQDREHTLDYLFKSHQLAQERVLNEVQTQFDALSNEIQTKYQYIEKIASILTVDPITFMREEDRCLMRNSLNKLLTTVPKLDALQALEYALVEACQLLYQKIAKPMISMKEQFLGLMAEMSLETSELSPSLKVFTAIHLPAALNDVHHTVHQWPSMATQDLSSENINLKINVMIDFMKQLDNHKATFGQSQSWSEEIKKLNLKRVQYTTQLITLRDQIDQLLQDLSIPYYQKDMEQQDNNNNNIIKYLLDNLVFIPSIISSTSYSPESIQQTYSLLKQILTFQSRSNPPGNEKLVFFLEKFQLILQSIQVNRKTSMNQLWKFLSSFVSVFQMMMTLSFDSQANLTIWKEESKKSLLQSFFMDELNMIQSKNINLSFEMTFDLQLYLHQLSDSTLTQIIQQLQLMNQNQTYSSQEIHQFIQNKVQSHLTGHLTNANEEDSTIITINNLLATITEVSDELDGMSMFIEEKWIQDNIDRLLRTWGHHNKCTVINQLILEAFYMCHEMNRLTSITEGYQELRKCDQALTKHLTEMEEFEQTSKQDRQKVLSGNSKLLIEEEKFRKNAKKKYEQLTEKMLQTFNKLMTTIASTSSNEPLSPSAHSNAHTFHPQQQQHLEVKIDLAALSLIGQNLVKTGISKERLELMRLYTSAATVPVSMATGNSNKETKPRTSLEKETAVPSAPITASNGSKKDSKPVSSLSSKDPKNKLSSEGSKGPVASKVSKPTLIKANNRLSISISEPGLFNGGPSSSMYSFQPPTPPEHELKSPKLGHATSSYDENSNANSNSSVPSPTNLCGEL